MEKRMIKKACCLVFGGALLWLLPSIGMSQCNVTSSGGYSGNSIQDAINSATSPVQISVTGTCAENLLINESKDYLCLSVPNGDTATIQGTDSTKPTITIIGRGITIGRLINSTNLQGNLTIKGNYDGIQVIRGGTAFIEYITIEETGRNGIVVAMNSFAHIVGSSIQNNPVDGIVADTGSLVRIGIRTTADSTARPNIIQGNANGVTVVRSATAQVVGNTIQNNSSDGVRVLRVSQADISNNTINGNGRYGILVTQNSGVNLGRDTGDTIFDSPNTTTVGNSVKGLSCSIGGYADGRLGTLNGVGKHNATEFTKDCIDSLIP